MKSMDAIQRTNRKEIETNNYSVSFLLTADLDGAPSFITPKDISATGISFETDVKINLNSEVNFIIKDKNTFEFCSLCGIVSRVDEINELNEPRRKFKIVVKYNDDSNILLKRILTWWFF